jgi:two-component system, sensor histidine kinase PdtaS
VQLVVLLALAMLPAGFLACLQAISNYRKMTTLSEVALLQTAVQSTREEENIIVAARRVLQTIVVLPPIRDLRPEACTEILRAVVETSAYYQSLMVTDGRGTVVCASASDDGMVAESNASWFRAVTSRKRFTVVGHAEASQAEDRILAVGLPVVHADGEIVGAAFLVLRARWLERVLAVTRDADIIHTALVDDNGDLIAHDGFGMAPSSWLPDPADLRPRLSGSPVAMHSANDVGPDAMLAIVPIMPEAVYMVVSSGGRAPPVHLDWRLVGALGLPIIMWVAALAVAWFAVNRLVIRPILHLQHTAAALGSGDQTVRAAVLDDAPAEIQQLAWTMNTMAENLERRDSDLNKALQEQRSLLREIHHRVKNNLQIVTSLLNLQLRSAPANGEHDALRATQHRIYALAKVHETLYRQYEDSSLRLDELLPEVVDHVRRESRAGGRTVNIHYDIDPVSVDSERAAPIALLVTEAVAFALNRSLPGPDGARLRIAFKRITDGQIVLGVHGEAGMTPPADVDRESLEERLIRALARQLRGALTMRTDDGFALEVVIPDIEADRTRVAVAG